jgi:hypothetical protein
MRGSLKYHQGSRTKVTEGKNCALVSFLRLRGVNGHGVDHPGFGNFTAGAGKVGAVEGVHVLCDSALNRKVKQGEGWSSSDGVFSPREPVGTGAHAVSARLLLKRGGINNIR